MSDQFLFQIESFSKTLVLESKLVLERMCVNVCVLLVCVCVFLDCLFALLIRKKFSYVDDHVTSSCKLKK